MRNLILQAHPNSESLSDEKLTDYCQGIVRNRIESNRFSAENLRQEPRRQVEPWRDGAAPTDQGERAACDDRRWRGQSPADATRDRPHLRGLRQGALICIIESRCQDNSNAIEAEELAGFAKDLLAIMKPVGRNGKYAKRDRTARSTTSSSSSRSYCRAAT